MSLQPLDLQQAQDKATAGILESCYPQINIKEITFIYPKSHLISKDLRDCLLYAKHQQGHDLVQVLLTPESLLSPSSAIPIGILLAT